MPESQTARLLDGKAIAAEIHAETARRVDALKSRNITPGVTFVRVGEDPASQAYVRMKGKQAEKLGIRSNTIVLAEPTLEDELLELLRSLNEQPAVHGILVQTPLPKQISEAAVAEAISPAKDIDGFHPVNFGKLLLGDKSGFRPCTPAGIHEMLIRGGVETEGEEVVVLGRGTLVGKPMAAILLQKEKGANATVTLLHSRSKDIAGHCRRADIIVAAMGQAFFVKPDMVKPGATVIDVGVNRIEEASAKRGYRLVGDVEFDKLLPIAGAITPNPGGVGPMTIAMLMQNTVLAAERLVL